MDKTRLFEYLNTLIAKARLSIKGKKYQEAFAFYMECNKYGYNGWSEEIQRIFTAPESNEEKTMSEDLKRTITEIIEGLLLTAKPTDLWSEYMRIESAAILLHHLGNEAPPEYVKKTRELILESREMGAPLVACINKDALELLPNFDDPHCGHH